MRIVTLSVRPDGKFRVSWGEECRLFDFYVNALGYATNRMGLWGVLVDEVPPCQRS